MPDKKETMLNEPVIIKGLDGKEYKISALSFPDAFKLADKLNLINTVPVVALMDPKQRGVEIVFWRCKPMMDMKLNFTRDFNIPNFSFRILDPAGPDKRIGHYILL